MKRNLLILLLFPCSLLFSQDTLKKDKAVFKEYKAGYYQNSILKGIEDFEEAEVVVNPKKNLTVDNFGLNAPVSPKVFEQYWHQAPVSQGNSGTCWSFATTSMLESEIFRIAGQKVKLSEMYFVYWEYVERAKYFIEHKGDCFLGEGSETSAFPRLMKNYGVMPDTAYSGMLEGQTVINHEKLFEEYETYLDYVKANDLWEPITVISNVRSILNSYLTQPPEEFVWEGKNYTPSNFMSEYCKLNPRDYFSFMSDNKYAWNQKCELVEDDNWWHCKEYYNISSDDFMKAIDSAMASGYTISICGDFSEPGIDKVKQTITVPTFDIPFENIDDDARQMRLSNGTTTDDHCVHLIGYDIRGGEKWYLIKDSSAGAFDGTYKGYRYMREDYVKLKMMNVLLYKYAASDILDKVIK